jgi:ketosteroid isomerase-like protein
VYLSCVDESGDDNALVRFSGHARASGMQIRGGVFQVFRFRNGLIARIEGFIDRAEPLKAAGVGE